MLQHFLLLYLLQPLVSSVSVGTEGIDLVIEGVVVIRLGGGVDGSGKDSNHHTCMIEAFLLL